jgi:hypothetical protein
MKATLTGQLKKQLTTGEKEQLTTGEVAQLVGVPYWKIRALLLRKLLPEVARVGKDRAFPRAMLPEIEAACRAAGYLGGK